VTYLALVTLAAISCVGYLSQHFTVTKKANLSDDFYIYLPIHLNNTRLTIRTFHVLLCQSSIHFAYYFCQCPWLRVINLLGAKAIY